MADDAVMEVAGFVFPDGTEVPVMDGQPKIQLKNGTVDPTDPGQILYAASLIEPEVEATGGLRRAAAESMSTGRPSRVLYPPRMQISAAPASASLFWLRATRAPTPRNPLPSLRLASPPMPPRETSSLSCRIREGVPG